VKTSEKSKKTLAEQRQTQVRYFQQKEAKEREELDLKRRIESEQTKISQLEDDLDGNKAEIKRKDQVIENLKKF